MRTLFLAVLVVVVVAGLSYLVYCSRCVDEDSRPVVGLNLAGNDILVICLDGTERGAQFCLHTLRKAKRPERVRFGVIQRRVVGSQNIVSTLASWHRQDILSRTRVTLVDDGTTLAESVVRAERDLHQYEPIVVLLSPHVSVAEGWDEVVTNLPGGLRVHSSAMLRKGLHDRPAFPVVDDMVRGIPSFRLAVAAEQKDDTPVDCPLASIMTQCLVLPVSAFILLSKKLHGFTIPDWAFPAVASSVLVTSYYRILHGGPIIDHLDMNAPKRMPVKTEWAPKVLRQFLSDTWTTYAGIGQPRGYLGITHPDTEMEWRWKWGDSNAQDVARERVGLED